MVLRVPVAIAVLPEMASVGLFRFRSVGDECDACALEGAGEACFMSEWGGWEDAFFCQ